MDAIERHRKHQAFVRTARITGWVLCFVGIPPAHALDPLQARLRIMTHNVYGLSNDVCDQRAKAFGHIVASQAEPYDVVGLNEDYNTPDGGVFTCDSGFLGSAIVCTGKYTQDDQSYRFYPESLTRPNGGIGIFTLGSICEFKETQFSHNDSLLTAVQGIIFARIEVPGTTLTLDVYVTHLHASDADDCDRCCRKQELQRLATFIRNNSSRSGNPVIVMGDFNISGPPNCCGNEGYEDMMSVLGNPRDLWFELHPCGDPPRLLCGDLADPCTADDEGFCNQAECEGAAAPPVYRCFDFKPELFGVCNDVQCSLEVPDPVCRAWNGATNNQCLNELGDGRDRIDYILLITAPTLTSNAYSLDVRASNILDWMAMIESPPLCPGCPYADCRLPNECQLCSDECLCKDASGFCSCSECDSVPLPRFAQHVSDHLGVEAEIDVFGTSAVWVDPVFSGSSQLGTSCNPFVTLDQGIAAVPPGNRILIRGGFYPNNLRVGRPMTLQAIGELVTLGH